MSGPMIRLVDALRRSFGRSHSAVSIDRQQTNGTGEAMAERHRRSRADDGEPVEEARMDDGPGENEPTEGERTTGERTATDDRVATVRSTGRWRGIVAVALLAVAVGVLAKRPPLLLVGAVGVVFAAYPLVTPTPDPAVSVTRRVAPESPNDGDAVDVRTTIRNEGDATLFDLRVVDGTPPMLSVEDGSPRCATTLRPGGEVTLAYELRARPGRHRFRPTMLLCRDASGSVEVETTVAAETTVACASRVPSVPLRSQSRHRTGPLVTDEGGSGLEFHSVTKYERGDPPSQIDWRRFARTGELTSVTFRTERLADVVVCVDARADAYRASDADEPHAVAHAVDAAGRISDVLLEANHRVGLAAFGPEGCLLAPGSGSDHADRLQRRLVTAPAFTLTPPESVRTTRPKPGTDTGDTSTTGAPDSLDRQLSEVRTQLGPSTQVILLTPLCDDGAHRVAQRLDRGAGAVTVITPDVTAGRSPGGRLARLERDHRLTALRNAGIPTVDWNSEEPLGAALTALERWER